MATIEPTHYIEHAVTLYLTYDEPNSRWIPQIYEFLRVALGHQVRYSEGKPK